MRGNTTKTLNINGHSVELIRSKRRTLSLELGVNGIKARAPMRMPEPDIVDFIASKQAWINKHVNQLPPTRAQPALRLVNGRVLHLRGDPFELTIIEGKRGPVEIRQNHIIVPIINSHTPVEQRVKNKLIKWYKHVAQHELQHRVRYYAERMNVPQRRTDQLYVRDYKRRWGSCDSKGKLSFNWRILQAPSAVSDYVVVHELAHCHEFNHSKQFWSIVSKQMPTYKNHEQWLYHNGHSLYAI